LRTLLPVSSRAGAVIHDPRANPGACLDGNPPRRRRPRQ
jgi:hypothetical protein